MLHIKTTILLLLIANIAFCQSPDDSKYSVNYVLDVLRDGKHKIVLSYAEGTKRAIRQIGLTYRGETQQKELIYFYKAVYDYKVVDKPTLDHLIDSLIENGVTTALKSEAKESKEFVTYRILGKKIKDFEFPDKDGNVIKLSSLSEKMVVIELWATWCGPCVKEMPLIPEIRTANPNVEFYSISFDHQPASMKKFLEKKKYDWPVVFGGYSNSELWDYLHIVAIPKYYTIDRKGIVVHVADHLDKNYLLSLK
jgi:thiol-disulfide isomerase/thioredoxin